MNFTMRYYGALVVGVMLLAGTARGDVAPEPLFTGGATASARDAKDTPVAMDWEEVDLMPTPEKNVVSATFLLRNTSDQATTLEVGFPSYNEIPMKDFVVEIDGQKAAAELKKQVSPAGPRKTITLEWMVWPMTFEGGAQKKIKVSYYVPPNRDIGWTVVTVRNGQSNWVTEKGVNAANTSLPDEVKQKVISYDSGYILRTGAGWHGNIGKAVIRLHYGELVRRDQFHFQSGAKGWNYDEKTNTDTLTLNDFKPDRSSDISYQFRISTPDEQAKLLLEGMRKGQLDVDSRLIVLEMIRSGKGQKELTAEQREKLLAEATELVVPPAGAAIDASQCNPRIEKEIQGIFEKLMARYKAANQNDKGLKVAEAYLKFMDESYATRYTKDWVAQRTAYWGDQKKKVAQYMGGIDGPGVPPAP